MNRAILVLFACVVVAPTSHASIINFPGSDNVLSWYRVTTPDYAGPGTVISATNTVIATNADVDDSALTLTFNGLSFDVQSEQASFGNSAIIPPGSLTPISISIRVFFDPFNGVLSASDPLQLTCAATISCDIDEQALNQLTSPIAVTGTYEVLGPNDPVTGPFSVDMSPTALFPGNAQLDVRDFPDQIKFTGQSAFSDGGASLFFTTVGDPRIIDLTIEGVPVFFDLNGWGANLSGLTLGETVIPIPIPAAAWLFGSALGLLGWMRRGRLNG